TDEADPLMQQLATRHPEDLFIVDGQTDIDLAKGRSALAIARLEQIRSRMPDNEVVVINLGNAYLESGQYQKSIALLDPYARQHEENNLAWTLLADAYRKAGRMTELHMARAELLVLRGDYQGAMDELVVARGTTRNKLILARLEARITELERAKIDLDSLKRG
ncbi:MAG: tetratricopeptide repeat protein, partial [Aeromonas sp.]